MFRWLYKKVFGKDDDHADEENSDDAYKKFLPKKRKVDESSTSTSSDTCSTSADTSDTSSEFEDEYKRKKKGKKRRVSERQ